MSIAVLARKSKQKQLSRTTGNQGFSLQGTYRNQGWVGQPLQNRSTRMCGGTADHAPPILDNTIVKKASMTTQAMIASRFTHPTGAYPYRNTSCSQTHMPCGGSKPAKNKCGKSWYGRPDIGDACPPECPQHFADTESRLKAKKAQLQWAARAKAMKQNSRPASRGEHGQPRRILIPTCGPCQEGRSRCPAEDTEVVIPQSCQQRSWTGSRRPRGCHRYVKEFAPPRHSCRLISALRPGCGCAPEAGRKCGTE